MTADYLDTKAAEVVDQICHAPASREILIAYVRAVLVLTENRGAMRRAHEIIEAIWGKP